MGEVTDANIVPPIRKYVAGGQRSVVPVLDLSRCGECGAEYGNYHFVYCAHVVTNQFAHEVEKANALAVNVMGNPLYLRLLAYMKELHVAKAAGYSGEGTDTWQNFRESEAWGATAWLGCAIRLGDKYRRLQNILRNPALDMLVGESALVTAIDLAAYALILVCLLDEAGIGSADDVVKTLK